MSKNELRSSGERRRRAFAKGAGELEPRGAWRQISCSHGNLLTRRYEGSAIL